MSAPSSGRRSAACSRVATRSTRWDDRSVATLEALLGRCGRGPGPRGRVHGARGRAGPAGPGAPLADAVAGSPADLAPAKAAPGDPLGGAGPRVQGGAPGVDHAPGHHVAGPPLGARAPGDARIGIGQMRAPAPPSSVRGHRARRACRRSPSSACGCDPDRGGEHRHVAGQRLEHGQPEALALGGDEHRVGGVDPQRDLRRARRRAASAAGRRRRPRSARSKRFSARAGSAGNSRHGSSAVEPERARAASAR